MLDDKEQIREGSITAQMTAVFRAIESKKPEGERILYDPYAHNFARVKGKELAENLEMASPGVHLTHIVRTRAIEDWVKRVITQGVEQLVILGAGYDCSCLRLEEIKERSVAVFEIDEPVTSQLKQEKIKEICGTFPRHVAYIQVDFERETLEDLRRKLLEKGYDPDKKTVFTLGGVIPYLTEEAVDNLFCFIASCCCPGSSVVFTNMDLKEMQTHTRAIEVEDKLAQIGEPFKFGIPPEEMAKFLRNRGFKDIQQQSIAQLKEGFGKASVLADPAYYVVSACITGCT